MTVREGYKEIDTTRRSTRNLDFQDDEVKQTVEIDIEDPIVPDQEQVETQVVVEQQPEPVKPKQEQKPSRAKERIRELAKQKNESYARVEQLEREKEELLKKLSEGNKASKSTLKEHLEQTVAGLTYNLKEAIKNGDADLTVSVQDALIEAKLELASLKQELSKEPEAVKPDSAEKPRQQQPQMPEKAQDWIDSHPEFKTDEEFYTATIVNNNKLIREGYDVESEEFYEELDRRLSKRFPEMFGISDESGVELSQSSSKVDTDSPEDVKLKAEKPKAETAKVRTTEQTVAGSSRNSNSAITIQPNKKIKVDLTEADIAQAARWDLTLEQMGRRIAHAEKNRRPDGYVPIQMDKNKK